MRLTKAGSTRVKSVTKLALPLPDIEMVRTKLHAQRRSQSKTREMLASINYKLKQRTLDLVRRWHPRLETDKLTVLVSTGQTDVRGEKRK